MTFDEYNTDDNFKGKSTADELVKIGHSEGKSREDIENSLSPLWKEDKQGNVKKALDKYYKVETPATETKPTEEKTVEEVITEEPKTEVKKSNLDAQTEDYMKKNNNISYAQEDAENERQANELGNRWDARLANIDKMSQAMKNIDDHMVEQLPTFLYRRYQNGEFGNVGENATPEEKKDAKLRLAHFVLNGVQSKLKNASNAAMVAAGRSPMFADTQSDWEKYQQSNFAKGMENRWRKYEADTQVALDLAREGGMSEEKLTDSISMVSTNARLQSAFNQMDERKKVFALKVLGEVGDKLGNMNDEQFVNTLFGMSAMGDSLDYKEAAGMLIYRFIKDPEKRKAALADIGLGEGNSVIAGVGGLLGGGKNSSKQDGDELGIGATMNDEDYGKLTEKADSLSSDFYNGKISKDEFVKEYDKLVSEMNKHKIYKWKTGKTILSTKDILNANKNLELKDKFGEDTKSKTFKNGKKALEYFDGKNQLAEYFKSTDNPNFLDAKKVTKNNDYRMKDYQEALKQYEILKNANATNMIGKY